MRILFFSLFLQLPSIAAAYDEQPLGWMDEGPRAAYLAAIELERSQLDALASEERRKTAEVRRKGGSAKDLAKRLKALRAEYREKRRAVVLKSRLEFRAKYPADKIFQEAQ